MPNSNSQLSRYGGITRNIPDLAPGSKMFLVADSDDTSVGALNIANDFPPDIDGVARVFTSIQAAHNAARSNVGDVVLVLPGFDFSLAGADSWVTPGVSVIGIQAGGLRPTVRFTAKTSEIGLSANNLRVSGMRFLAAADSIARAVDMDTGFSNMRFDNNEFDFSATTFDFRVMLRMGAPKSVVEDNKFVAEDTAGAGSAVLFKGGAPSYSVVRRNYFYGQFDTVGDTFNTNGVSAPIAQDTTDTADTNFSGLLIQDNLIVNTDTAVAAYIKFSAGYTKRGLFTGNRMVGYDSATADTSKISMVPAANNELKSTRNYAVGDSGTEKLIGDSFIINV